VVSIEVSFFFVFFLSIFDGVICNLLESFAHVLVEFYPSDCEYGTLMCRDCVDRSFAMFQCHSLVCVNG
jgi:hypothetical protein